MLEDYFDHNRLERKTDAMERIIASRSLEDIEAFFDEWISSGEKFEAHLLADGDEDGMAIVVSSREDIEREFNEIKKRGFGAIMHIALSDRE